MADAVCCFAALNQAGDTAVEQQFVGLPWEQQVSRGKELLQMLREQKQQSDSRGAAEDSLVSGGSDDVDVEVIVKHTFIEVVDPTLRRMTRSMSDAALVSSSRCERSWESVEPCKKRPDALQDLSDASTEDLDHISGEETGLSDDDAPADAFMAACSPDLTYQYAGHAEFPEYAWEWMPMGFDAETMMCAPMMNADGSFMPMQWVGMDCQLGDAEQMTWTDHMVDPDSGEEWRTTVMLRNMPNNYTREMLLELIDSMGFAGTYDFAYLPIDFSSQAGLGYAFINFVSPEKALLCFDVFEGFSDWTVPSEKVCTVTWSSPYQGLENHIERYQNSPVMHHSIADDWKPILLSNGVRVPFPPPTKAIKTPKVRQTPKNCSS
jgi:hypothetical protein